MSFMRSNVATYNRSVRVGNWSEDTALAEDRLKAFQKAREDGKLLCQRVDQTLQTSLMEVGVTFSTDGFLHYGDHIMLYSAETEGVLSCDPSDIVNGVEKGFACSTSTVTKAPVARNVFVVEAAANEPHKTGDLVRYGAPIRLAINPHLVHILALEEASKRPSNVPYEVKEQKYYLHSQPLSNTACSKRSKLQLVCFAADESFATVWKCASRDVDTRFEFDTTPVIVNSEFVLFHSSTGRPLACTTTTRYPNDFGLEYEVIANSYLNVGKNHGLVAEKLGKTTSDTPKRREESPNHFAILTSQHPSMELKIAKTPEQQRADDARVAGLLIRLRTAMLPQGIDGIYKLSRELRRTNSKSMTYGLFTDLMSGYGFFKSFTKEETRTLCVGLDPWREGIIDYSQMLKTIRNGDLKGSRRSIITQIFEQLDENGEDAVPLQRILDNLKSTVYVNETSRRWSDLTQVSRFEFFDYYSSKGMFMPDDRQFEQALKDEWKLSWKQSEEEKGI